MVLLDLLLRVLILNYFEGVFEIWCELKKMFLFHVII